jgi:hypothetical protein
LLLLAATVGACSEPLSPSRPTAVGSQAQFAKSSTDPTSTWKFALASAVSVRGDGKYSDGTYSVYANGACGTKGGFFATTANSNSGDVTLTLSADRTCVNSPRSLTIAYDDGVVEVAGGGTFVNLHAVENTTSWIPIGQTAPRFLAIHYTPRCDALQFGKDANSDAVLVTRIDAHTWHAVSQASPNDRAFCTTTGRSYLVPVDLIIVSSRDLP